MGRRKSKMPRVSLRVSISQATDQALERLAAEGFHGVTVPEVATRLLERKVREMFDAGWVPKATEVTGEPE